MIRFAAIAAVALGTPVVAQTAAVEQARATGSVGERFDGYLGFNGPAPAAVRGQVVAINIKRRALYSDLAARKGASPQDVGITAGCALIARTAIGGSYLLTDGVWRRRAAGQPAPEPDYCR